MFKGIDFYDPGSGFLPEARMTRDSVRGFVEREDVDHERHRRRRGAGTSRFRGCGVVSGFYVRT